MSNGRFQMNKHQSDKLYVNLSASQVRRRLKGHGFGVRKVQSAGRNQAVILHTATGQHLRELQALLADVMPSTSTDDVDGSALETFKDVGTKVADGSMSPPAK